MDVQTSEHPIVQVRELQPDMISAIIPITERHDDIGEIYHEYKDALNGLNVPHEFIFVVDGHFDKAFLQLKSLRNGEERLTIIKHARTFGESSAIMAGYRKAVGNIILLAPPYHQIDMGELPNLYGNLNDVDMVIVRRWPRSDSWLNQFQTSLYHSLVKLMAGKVASDIGCGIRMFRREVLDEVYLYGDLHRFLPIMADRQGFKIREIDARQSPKEKRMRTYPIGVYLRRVIDLLTVFFLVKFTRKPLRFFGLTGMAVLATGLAVTSYLVLVRLFFNVGLSDRPLFLIGILLIVLGLQIFAIGLIGEIVIFTHATEMKDYNIEEIVN